MANTKKTNKPTAKKVTTTKKAESKPVAKKTTTAKVDTKKVVTTKPVETPKPVVNTTTPKVETKPVVNNNTQVVSKKSNKVSVSKKGFIAGICAATLLIGGLGGAAGYFAYKSFNNTNSGEVIVDPTKKDEATISEVSTTDGNKEFNVTTQKAMTGIKVSIGSNLLVEDTDYTIRESDSNTAKRVVIYKKTIDKYKGKGNIVITPMFDTPSKEYVVVSFDTDGGSFIASQKIEKGNKVTKPTADPTKKGYEFDCWKNGNEVFNFDTAVNSDLTLKATWKGEGPQPEEKVSVVFNLNYEGSKPNVTQIVKGGKVSAPTEPSRSGYTFKGWKKDPTGSEAFDFNVAINEDVVIYASWEEGEKGIKLDSDKTKADEQAKKALYLPLDTENRNFTITRFKEDKQSTKQYFGEYKYNINVTTINEFDGLNNCSEVKLSGSYYNVSYDETSCLYYISKDAPKLYDQTYICKINSDIFSPIENLMKDAGGSFIDAFSYDENNGEYYGTLGVDYLIKVRFRKEKISKENIPVLQSIKITYNQTGMSNIYNFNNYNNTGTCSISNLVNLKNSKDNLFEFVADKKFSGCPSEAIPLFVNIEFENNKDIIERMNKNPSIISSTIKNGSYGMKLISNISSGCYVDKGGDESSIKLADKDFKSVAENALKFEDNIISIIIKAFNEDASKASFCLAFAGEQFLNYNLIDYRFTIGEPIINLQSTLPFIINADDESSFEDNFILNVDMTLEEVNLEIDGGLIGVKTTKFTKEQIETGVLKTTVSPISKESLGNTKIKCRAKDSSGVEWVKEYSVFVGCEFDGFKLINAETKEPINTAKDIMLEKGETIEIKVINLKNGEVVNCPSRLLNLVYDKSSQIADIDIDDENSTIKITAKNEGLLGGCELSFNNYGSDEKEITFYDDLTINVGKTIDFNTYDSDKKEYIKRIENIKKDDAFNIDIVLIPDDAPTPTLIDVSCLEPDNIISISHDEGSLKFVINVISEVPADWECDVNIHIEIPDPQESAGKTIKIGKTITLSSPSQK